MDLWQARVDRFQRAKATFVLVWACISYMGWLGKLLTQVHESLLPCVEVLHIIMIVSCLQDDMILLCCASSPALQTPVYL